MLVNAKEMLDKAYENGYGIGQLCDTFISEKLMH